MNVTRQLKCIIILQLVASICSIYLRVVGNEYKDGKDNALVNEVAYALLSAVFILSFITFASSYLGGNNKLLLNSFGGVVSLSMVSALFTVLLLYHKYSDYANTWIAYCAWIGGLTAGITVIVLSWVFIWHLLWASRGEHEN